MSKDSFSPFMGSALFSWMYFSIRRRSYMQPDTGDRTGCSGTSLLTAKEIEMRLTLKAILNKTAYSNLDPGEAPSQWILE